MKSKTVRSMLLSSFRFAGFISLINIFLAFLITKAIVAVFGQEEYGRLAFIASLSAYLITLVSDGENLCVLKCIADPPDQRKAIYSQSFARRLILFVPSLIVICIAYVFYSDLGFWYLAMLVGDSLRSLTSPSVGDIEGFQINNLLASSGELLGRGLVLSIIWLIAAKYLSSSAILSTSFISGSLISAALYFAFFRRFYFFSIISATFRDPGRVKKLIISMTESLKLTTVSMLYLGFGMFYRVMFGYIGDYSQVAQFSISWSVAIPMVAIVELFIRNRVKASDSLSSPSSSSLLSVRIGHVAAQSTAVGFILFCFISPIAYGFIARQPFFDSLPLVLSANIYAVVAIGSRVRQRQLLMVAPAAENSLLVAIAFGASVSMALTILLAYLKMGVMYAYLPLIIGHGSALILQNRRYSNCKPLVCGG